MFLKRMLTLLLAFVLGFTQLSRADEGMWPLTLIQQLQNDMQARGLQLTAEDIYSINKASVKDAVVRLMSKQNRMFCTGEIISEQGLFLTNHHCGYGAIQELSTPEDNILANGFWAKSQAEERKANFNIALLLKVEDVTSLVLDSIGTPADEAARSKAIAERLPKLSAQLKEQFGASKDNYLIEVVPFWAGNKYLAMFYEVYSDIRLVGTPPENIGKFGGETDNWMWPRHTCDFSMFRIYANAENKPAGYSADNKPYKPRHFFPVNLQGVKENDYAMIMGYPGRTQRFTPSAGIKYYADKERPMRVKVRRDILDVYEEYMHADPNIKLMYADKFAGLSNYWKKFMGEADALKKLDLYSRRKAAESEFSIWASNKSQFGDVLSTFDKGFTDLTKIGMYSVYMQDGVSNSQPMVFAMGMNDLAAKLADKTKADDAKKIAEEQLKGIDEQFKEFYAPIEQRVLETVLRHLVEDLDPSQLPAALVADANKHSRNYKALADDYWKRSMFVSKEKMAKFLKSPSLKALNKDPLYVMSVQFKEISQKLRPETMRINTELSRASRLFQQGEIEMHPNKLPSPDANGTMRLTYGRVLPYNGKDAVSFKEYTTSKGIIEKYVPGDIEFDAPKRLIDLMKARDFGQYADKDGELHICFLTDNDITGGNSGSPVINARGELIGTAFDGNWEAISSDFAFEPNYQRTICVDIRYTLFIVDKFGGAGRLLDEMKIVR
jgi:hypothetical protein